FEHEVVGIERLDDMARSLFGDEDPSTIYYHSVPQQVRRLGTGYELVLQLPFVSKDEVVLTHREGELFVTVGAYKREISLPPVLAGRQTTSAKLEEGMLRIGFGSARR